jgi:tripartite-type tricarboxylate transporter receptor subunit TctC
VIGIMNFNFLFFLLFFCGIATAQVYPSKPITIVVGSTPGSTTDGLARAMGQEITKETGQPVIVDNRAGAFGGIAAQYAAASKPDGYTLFITTNTTQAANPHLFKKLSYDPVKDFEPITQLVQGYMLMVVNPAVKANSVQELIALAKANPDKLTFGAGSSSAQVAVELFKKMTGTKMVYVPYKSNPLAVMDLVGGQTDVMIVDLTTSLPQVKNEKLRALGVSSLSKSGLVPRLPTIAASGVPGYEFYHWNALYGPAGMDPSIVQRINSLARKAVSSPAVRKWVEENGMEVVVTSPEGLAVFQESQLKKWGQIIKEAGIQPE